MAEWEKELLESGDTAERTEQVDPEAGRLNAEVADAAPATGEPGAAEAPRAE